PQGDTARSPESSPRRSPPTPELPQQIAHFRRLERLAPLARVVEKTAPGLRAQLVTRDLLLDQPRRAKAVVAERLGQKPAGPMQDVDATPVDELEDAHRRVAEAHAGAKGSIDVFRRRHAFLDQAHGL